MGLTILTRHPAAASLRLEQDAAKIETDPITGAVVVTSPENGAFLMRVSAADFAVAYSDAVTVTTVPVVP